MQKISPIQPARRFASPADMAAALGTSRYPLRGAPRAHWVIQDGKAGRKRQPARKPNIAGTAPRRAICPIAKC